MFSFKKWLRNLSGRNSRATKRSAQRRATPLRVETLEERLAPAAITWQGTTTSWNTPSNWSTGTVPGTADDVTIVANNGGTVTAQPTLDVDASVHDLAV